MNFNPNFQGIGQEFVKAYYSVFDGMKAKRGELAQFYTDHSLMTFEGSQISGKEAVMGKITGLPFEKIQRDLTTVDCQPTFDGGVLITVLGQIKLDEDPIHGFAQTFVLRPKDSSFYVAHDTFRLVIHNM